MGSRSPSATAAASGMEAGTLRQDTSAAGTRCGPGGMLWNGELLESWIRAVAAGWAHQPVAGSLQALLLGLPGLQPAPLTKGHPQVLRLPALVAARHVRVAQQAGRVVTKNQLLLLPRIGAAGEMLAREGWKESSPPLTQSLGSNSQSAQPSRPLLMLHTRRLSPEGSQVQGSSAPACRRQPAALNSRSR